MTAFCWQAAASPTLQAGDGTPPTDPTEFTSTVDWGDGTAPFVTQASWLEQLTSQHLYANAGVYYTTSTTSVSGSLLWGAWVSVNNPQLKLGAIADQTVAPGKSVDVTASYAGLVGAGYGFIDWGDGKGPQPLGAVGGGAVPTSGSVSGHYDSVPDTGLFGTLYLYDMHGKWVSRGFDIFSGDAVSALTLGIAEKKSLFTPMFLDIPNSIDESGATFTLTYSASNPNNDTVTGSGTFSDPDAYTAAAGAFTIWTVDGSKDFNPTDLNSGGNFIDFGVSYPLSSLSIIDQADGNHAWGLYIEAVSGSISAAVGAVSISVTNGGGDPVTAALSNPSSPDVSILPISTSGTSASQSTSNDSAAGSGASSSGLPQPPRKSNREPLATPNRKSGSDILASPAATIRVNRTNTTTTGSAGE